MQDSQNDKQNICDGMDAASSKEMAQRYAKPANVDYSIVMYTDSIFVVPE